MVRKSENPKDDAPRYIAVVVAAIGAFVGGSGGTFVMVNSGIAESVVRPDPFTGTQAAQHESRIDALERRVDALPPRELEFAVLQCESAIEDLRRDLREHMDRHQ